MRIEFDESNDSFLINQRKCNLWTELSIVSIFVEYNVKRFHWCFLRKCANNEELDRPYTVLVETKINMVDRTLLKLNNNENGLAADLSLSGLKKLGWGTVELQFRLYAKNL